VGLLPNEAPPEESKPPQQGRARNNCPAPNRKRPSTCLAEAGQIAACTNQRGNAAAAAGSRSSVEEDAGGDLVEEDSKPSPVTSSALIGSDPDEEVVKKEETSESEQMAATSTRTNERGARSKATGTSRGSVEEKDGGNRDEEDSKPSLVTSSALPIGSYPHQEVVVQEEATTPDEIPSGWTRVKLEPDC
jgi:hypothetical protein